MKPTTYRVVWTGRFKVWTNIFKTREEAVAYHDARLATGASATVSCLNPETLCYHDIIRNGKEVV